MSPTTRGKGAKLLVLADGQGTSLGGCVEKTPLSEVTRLEQTLKPTRVTRHHSRPHQPQRLISDSGSDIHHVRALVVNLAMEPVTPKRRNSMVATHQDGRPLRRYRVARDH